MDEKIKKILLSELNTLVDKLQEDKCEMTSAEAMSLIGTLTHEAMSKEQVLIMLGWSRSRFDDYCARGLMPKGRKRAGWKELVWFKDEINDALIVLRNKYKLNA